MVVASTLPLSSAYKTSVFSEINPVPLFFLKLKILPVERSSESQNYKTKITDQILGYISFYFGIRAQ